MFALVAALLIGAPPGPTIHTDPVRGVPRAIFGLDEATTGDTAAARALDFVQRRAELLGGVAFGDLRVSRVSGVRGGQVVYLQPHLDKRPVHGRYLAIRLDQRGHVRRVHSDLDRWTLADAPLTVDADRARAIAARHVQAATTGVPTQVALPVGPGAARVAWRVPAARVPLLMQFNVFVDAASGQVLRADPAALDQPREVPR